MRKGHLRYGAAAEGKAAEYLLRNGYELITRNYRCRLGEIDIIARDGDTICFIEVKARVSQAQGLPQEAVGDRKQRQISKAALVFLKENKLLEHKARFDVVSIDGGLGDTRIGLIKNAFELDPGFTI